MKCHITIFSEILFIINFFDHSFFISLLTIAHHFEEISGFLARYGKLIGFFFTNCILKGALSSFSIVLKVKC